MQKIIIKSFMFQQIQNLKDGWGKIGHVWKDTDMQKGNFYCLQMQIQNILDKSYHYQFHIC